MSWKEKETKKKKTSMYFSEETLKIREYLRRCVGGDYTSITDLAYRELAYKYGYPHPATANPTTVIDHVEEGKELLLVH